MSLTALLLTFLFSFFAQSAKLEKRLDSARIEITARQYLQTRLQDILTSIKKESVQIPIYTKLFPGEKQDSLLFIFDNGIDPDPDFSGTVLGRLFLDEEKNISLAIWPIEKEKIEHWRKEILFAQVSHFEFEFLVPKKETKGKIRAVNGSLEWRYQLPKEFYSVPSIIRLSIWEKQDEEKPIQFAFILPSQEPIVTYWEKKL